MNHHTVRVWDLPTRAFHWLLAAVVIGAVVTGYIGGGLIDWHARLGYAALALLLFRIIWGLVGGHWSRFRNFLYGPRSLLAYVRGQPHPDHLVGHTPLGAASVFAMLTLMLLQVASGLIATDDISFSGPLNRFVSDAQGSLATWYHKQVGQWIVIGLVALHAGAIAYYLWRKKLNLIGPMVFGDRRLRHAARPSRDDRSTWLLAFVIFAACAAAVYRLVSLGA